MSESFSKQSDQCHLITDFENLSDVNGAEIPRASEGN